MPTPAEIDRIGRSRDPDVLDAAADACEEAGDDARADALRWRAVLGRVARTPRSVGVAGEGWEALARAHHGSSGLVVVWVYLPGGVRYRLTRGGWATRLLTRRNDRRNLPATWRLKRCPAPACAPAVLAALRAALARVV